MSWTIDYYSEDVRLEIDALPVGIRASYARLTELLKSSDSNSECPIHVQWGMDFSNYGRADARGSQESFTARKWEGRSSFCIPSSRRRTKHRSGNWISPAGDEGRLSRHDQETTEEDTPPDG